MEVSKPTERVCMDTLHRLMRQKMLSKITVQDILDGAGISKATFYRHYKDKEDLFGKMIRRDVNYIFTDDCNLDQWSVRVVQFIETLRQEHSILYRLARNDSNAFQIFYTNVMYELFMKRLYRIHSKQYEVTTVIRRRFLFMCAGAAAVLQDWIMDGCAESAESIAAEIATLFTANARNTPLENLGTN